MGLLTLGSPEIGYHSLVTNGTDGSCFKIFDPWGSVYNVQFVDQKMLYATGSKGGFVPYFYPTSGAPVVYAAEFWNYGAPEVIRPPVPVVDPTDATFVEGEEARFSVKADGKELLFKWTVNGKAIETDPVAFDSSGTSESVLNLASVDRTDDGAVIKVVVSNEAGFFERSAKLKVKYAPRFISELPSGVLSFAEGSTQKFHLRATGNPEPTYQWYFNDMAIAGETFNVLNLVNLRRNMTGAYKLVAINEIGRVEALYIVDVQYAPEIKGDLQSQVVIEGSRVQFFIDVDSNPKASISWFKDGKEMQKGESALVISAAKKSDQGTYHAVVANELGRVTSKKVTLKVTLMGVNSSMAEWAEDPNPPDGESEPRKTDHLIRSGGMSWIDDREGS